ncbi:hypothetical protein [Halosegnis longus]|uniref:hypothetical protein n=1 Tax=Halosegnis longus TaxID=2216012 RepID=UPI00129D6F2A|nr:hypothetical protein [Halosegnis longus]
MEPGTMANQIVFSSSVDADMIGDGSFEISGTVMLRDGETLVGDLVHLGRFIPDDATDDETHLYHALEAEYGSYLPEEIVEAFQDLLETPRTREKMLEGVEETQYGVEFSHGLRRIIADIEDDLEDDDADALGDVPDASNGETLEELYPDTVAQLQEDALDGISEEYQIEVTVAGSLDHDRYEISTTVGDHDEDLLLTASESSEISDIIISYFENREADGESELDTDAANSVYRTYRTARAQRVSTNKVQQFVGSVFDSRMIDVRDDGWVIADTFYVGYNGENYLTEDTTVPPHNTGGELTNYDGRHEFITFSIDTAEEMLFSIGEDTVIVSEKEQRFLATVELLTTPGDYLGVNNFEAGALSAIKRAISSSCPELERLTTTVSVSAFLDPNTGFVHRHSLNKHTLTSSFGVTREVVSDLEYSSYDHAGVNELVYREEELRNAELRVFRDHDNDDDELWQRIRNTANLAQIDDRIHAELRATYGAPLRESDDDPLATDGDEN